MKRFWIAAIMAAGLICGSVVSGHAVDDWKFEITPYIWGVGIDGDVTVGDQRAEFSRDFGDILDQMDLSTEVLAVIQYKRFVGFVQYDYLKLSQDEFSNPDAQANVAEVTLDSSFLTVAGGYQFPTLKNSWIDVMVGGRFVFMDVDVDLRDGTSREKSKTISDAILVLRPNFQITGKLRFNPTLSIGAGDSDLVYELQPQFQYAFTENFGIRVGYRLLHYEYKTDGDADIDIDFSGPIAGATFRF